MTSSASTSHSPTLDTIRMIEKFAREHSGEYRRRAMLPPLRQIEKAGADRNGKFKNRR